MSAAVSVRCSNGYRIDAPDESYFLIPVPDTQAYHQFANAVVVQAFKAATRLMCNPILARPGSGNRIQMIDSSQ